MRIIAGAWRGRVLIAPPGLTTRPTGQRMRQAIFDMLMHAPWGGRALLDGASVLDGFAGSGAMGLEALSRGAAQAVFMDRDAASVGCVRENVARCGAEARCRVIPTDLRRPPRGTPQAVVFLDPPYNEGLVPLSVAALRNTGWIIPGTVVISEQARLESATECGAILAHRVHGAAQVSVWREG